MNTVRNNNLGELLQKLVSNPDNYVKSIICVVREYILDGQTITVEPINSEDFDFTNGNTKNYVYDVRLTAFDPSEYDQVGLISVPKIGSYVIVSFIEDGDKYVSTYSQVEQFQVYTEGGSQLTMKQDDSDKSSVLLKSEITVIQGSEQGYIGDVESNNFLAYDNTTPAMSIYSNGQLTLQSEDSIGLDAIGNVEISGSKINIYNSITDLKTILSDLITTLNTNAVPDLTLVAPYGAGTGPTLAIDLGLLQTKINALLA